MNIDITLPYQPAKIAKAISEHIHSGVFSLKNSNAASVLDFLYTAYADVQGSDPKEIEQGFMELDKHLEGMGYKENNAIFAASTLTNIPQSGSQASTTPV